MLVRVLLILRTPALQIGRGPDGSAVTFHPAPCGADVHGTGLRAGEAAWASGLPMRREFVRIAPCGSASGPDPAADAAVAFLFTNLALPDRIVSVDFPITLSSAAELEAMLEHPDLSIESGQAHIGARPWRPAEGDLWACKTCKRVFSVAHGRSECPAFPGGNGCDPVWSGSRRYHLFHGSTLNTGFSQDGWALCWKCKAVFFALRPGSTRCAHGGHHEAGSLPLLKLSVQDPRTYRCGWPHETNLKWCSKCEGLFLWQSGAAAQGVCSGGAGGHDGSRSGTYFVRTLDEYDAQRYSSRERVLW